MPLRRIVIDEQTLLDFGDEFDWRPDAVAMPTTSSQPAVWGLSTGRRCRRGTGSATTGAVAGGR